jgi:hypothetical protein
LFFFHATTFAEERYPFRLPDWLWIDDPRYSILISDSYKQEILTKLKQAELAELEKRDLDAERLEKEAVKLLHSLLSLREIVRGATLVHETTSNRTIAVHIDPQFPADMRPVIEQAITIYLRLATNRDVVAKAMASSVEKPDPMPSEKGTAEGGDSPNPLYINYLQSVQKPESEGLFIREVDAALSRSSVSPPLLVISSYRGGVWWGGGIYDFFRQPVFALSRIEPAGFLYIRLNADKMAVGSPRYNDPKFWASKISHEVLHNLGYWHPPYKDPQEREKYNKGNTGSFLVAYEKFILEAADAEKP